MTTRAGALARQGGMSTNAADSRLSRYIAARVATRSSRSAQEPEHELLRLNRQYTSYRALYCTVPMSFHRQSARPPTRLEEVWRWVLARALAVCGAVLARLRALLPMMMNDEGARLYAPTRGGGIRSTREAGICELSKLAEGS